MKLARNWPMLVLTLIFLIISGCAGERPPAATFRISASSDLNPDLNDRASPVVLKIFSLRSADAFNTARFFDLYENSNDVLGIDQLGQLEFRIRPGQTQELDELTFDLETRFIGFVAAFRDLDNAVWKATMPVQINEAIEFEVSLDRLSLSVK